MGTISEGGVNTKGRYGVSTITRAGVGTIINCLLAVQPCISMELISIDKVSVPLFHASHGLVCQIP